MIVEEKIYKQFQDPELLDQIELEDDWDNEFLKEKTYWFAAPKYLIEDEFPEADIAVICVAVPYGENQSRKYRLLPDFRYSAEIWACKDNTDYDYSSVPLPRDFVEKLLEKVKIETHVKN